MSNNNKIPGQASQLEHQLEEVFEELWGNYVDSRDALYDADGIKWSQIGSFSGSLHRANTPFQSERELSDIRAECRDLGLGNEFAINGHENRISYIVGRGHSYRVLPKNSTLKLDTQNPGQEHTTRLVQSVIEQFVEVNNWKERQAEIVRRKDRDGEAFLRFFIDREGVTRVRFIEPDQVFTPQKKTSDPNATFGVQTLQSDVETASGYWVDEQWIDASEVQHRKSNVDSNVKRGLPLYFPVRSNLRRAEKLLRNMSVVAEIQSSIAIIRKHNSGTQSSIRRFVENQAELTATNPATGRTNSLQRYAPGTILDAFSGTDYEFPAAAIDAGSYVTVLQAELRAIASRLVMPEFMLTSDASNANYASTMVAEGPAVRMFERMQHQMIVEDLEVMRRVVLYAEQAGVVPNGSLSQVTIEGVPPTLAVRDRLQESRADEILVRNGAMSRETMAMRHGLVPNDERRRIASERESDD